MSTAQLAALARRLNRDAGAEHVPALYFFTDGARTPDPVRVAQTLPRGAAVVYRHFGADERLDVARALARVCRSRGLALLIAADPDLAQRVGAAGVHWPERDLPSRRTPSFALVTAAAHSAEAVARAVSARADACFLSPVFPTNSTSGRAALGLFRASQIARAAAIPTIALGGVNAHTSARLAGRGFAGLAAVEALSA
jgi:thiamine-phosphate pyrophosphorylase